jgi:glycosyltransferase involved in cell wall biosynthesis
MIVKNKAHCIKRCLNSVKPLIDYWVIVDNGSTDGTPKIIKEFLKDIKGELHERPWINFRHNKNDALILAKGNADYILFMDPEDKLAFPNNFTWPLLNKDYYMIKQKIDNTIYYRPMLIKDSPNLNWKEYEDIYNSKKKSEFLKNIICLSKGTKERSKDFYKYHKVAATLEKKLYKNPNHSTYRFYLAESYKACRNYPLAIENYQKRVKLGGCGEEVFYSLYQIAKLQQLIKKDPKAFIKSCWKAFLHRPSRLESLYQIITHYRKTGQYELGYAVGKIGQNIPYPNDALFVEDSIYKYNFPLELSICAYWTGHYVEAKILSERLLKIPSLPKNIKECLIKNLSFIDQKLKISKNKSPQKESS